MSSLDGLGRMLNFLAEHGVWDAITAAAAVAIAVLLKGRSRKPLREVTVHVTHSFGNDNGLFPNTLGFELRNPLDAPVILTRPSFRFAKHIPAGSAAHADTVSGEVEMKFRLLLSDGTSASQLSHPTAMLRHREGAFTFVPVDDSLSEEGFLKLAHNRPIGTLLLDVVLLGESPPRSLSLKLPIRLTQRATQEHTFGVDGRPVHGKRGSDRPSGLPMPAE
jgi:hypothetical protein